MSGRKIIEGLKEALEWMKYVHIPPDDGDVRQCFCVGPQNGSPLCPCRMRGVRIVDGRYVEIIDHGPAFPTSPDTEKGEG